MADPARRQADNVTASARPVFAEQPQTVPRARAPTANDVATHLEAEFRQGATNAIRQTHDAHIPVPILGDDGKIAWLHPDGIVRPTRELVHTDDQT